MRHFFQKVSLWVAFQAGFYIKYVPTSRILLKWLILFYFIALT